MDPKERAFHASYKPSWGPGTTLIYSIPGKVGISQTKTTQTDPILKYRKSAIVSEGRDIRFAKIAVAPHVSAFRPIHRHYVYIFIYCTAYATNPHSTTRPYNSLGRARSTNGEDAADSFRGFCGSNTARY